MANHVYNQVLFKSPEDKREFFKLLNVDPWEKKERFSFEWLIPSPQTRKACDKKYIVKKGDDIQIEEKRPWFNWYDWNSDVWGTKWDCWDVINDYNSEKLLFTTAWSAPEPIFHEMDWRGDGFIDEIVFVDEGPNFAGYYDFIGECCKCYSNPKDIYTVLNVLTGADYHKDPDTDEWFDLEYAKKENQVFFTGDIPHYFAAKYKSDEKIIEYHKKYGKPFDELLVTAAPERYRNLILNAGSESVEEEKPPVSVCAVLMFDIEKELHTLKILAENFNLWGEDLTSTAELIGDIENYGKEHEFVEYIKNNWPFQHTFDDLNHITVNLTMLLTVLDSEETEIRTTLGLPQPEN